MNQIIIESFSKYIEHIEKNYNRDYVFRGLNSVTYTLIPKIGRQEYVDRCPPNSEPQEILDKLQDLEESAVHDFVRKSIPYIDLQNRNAWDQWTIGQHHGLPTRFLDWTENPMIAAYFAVENAGKNDVAVYVTNRKQFNTNTDEYEDVFSSGDEVLLHEPSYINDRIIAQKGLFTVHKNPLCPLNETKINNHLCEVDQLIIKNSEIHGFINDLDWCGINRSFIYPGLDGLAYYLDLKAKGGVG